MALIYHKQTGNGGSFAIWKIEENAADLLKQLQLKEHETSYLDSLAKSKRNLHWLSTRVLLRHMVNTTDYIDCQVDDSGKPYLTNFPHHISLSHSFDYAAVMINPDHAVGIDIELISSKIERIAHKFMSAHELAFMDSENKIKHLYVCWCAKEAVYKLQGKKNVSFLDNIHLHSFKFDAAGGSVNCSLETAGLSRQFTVHYEELNGYMLGYVSDVGIETLM